MLNILIAGVLFNDISIIVKIVKYTFVSCK